MNRLLLIVTLFVSGCATADISVNHEYVKPVKTVLILPFHSSLDLKKEIYTQSEDRFRLALLKLNYTVIDRIKSDDILNHPEYQSSGITSESAKKIAKQFGADAYLTGEIIENSEYQNIGIMHRPFVLLSLHHRHHDSDITIVFKFRIIVKLINTSDGTEIFKVENRYPETEENVNMPLYLTLEEFRNTILDRMTKELVETLNSVK